MANLQVFIDIGMSESKAKETLKNENLSNTLLNLISKAREYGKITHSCGNLLYYLATKTKPQIVDEVNFLVGYIVKNEIDGVTRLDAALDYLLSSAQKGFSRTELEKACGIGVTVTVEDVRRVVEGCLEQYKGEIVDKRYRFNCGPLLKDVRTRLKWADGKEVKREVDAALSLLLGPKRPEDEAPAKTKKTAEKTEVKAPQEVLTIEEMIRKLQLHNPGENFKTDGFVLTPNTHALLEDHLKATGGKVRTRFPPEPNGILHIGHAKAININFGYAAYHRGICFLRYDDTNPEKEEEKYFTGIKEMVEWLGYAPYKVTYSSDYFEQLYEFAVKLIKKNLAYVCHQKQEEMQGFNTLPSPWRDRSIEENLALFEDMKNGKMDEGESTLRMKITLAEGKQDPVAYRIKYVSHHRTGDKWCIYPTYDFTHCLCDSLENITHSLCTKEFQSRRSSYYWLCNALDIYCPVQWEYGRLNMNYTVVSKRKIAKLIENGIVKDWDDPRLFTLTALRRRGYPPEAINRFCARVGVTGAQSVVDPEMLEASVRDVLNVTAPRTMVVLEPLEIVCEGVVEQTIRVPDFPAAVERSHHSIKLTETLYIESSDFRKTDEKGYRRLTPTQPVGLRYANLLLRFVSQGKDNIKARVEPITQENRPKAFVHWVSAPDKITVRLYNRLFKHKNPEDTSEVPEGFLSDVSDDSLFECEALADAHLCNSLKNGDCTFRKFQFERLGYFSVDPDSTASRYIFNRTVSLKEDSGKS